MRIISYKEAEIKYQGKYEGEILGAESADWKSPQDVLEGVDRQLKKYGLELIQIDSGNDSFTWVIDKRDTNAKINL